VTNKNVSWRWHLIRNFRNLLCAVVDFQTEGELPQLCDRHLLSVSRSHRRAVGRLRLLPLLPLPPPAVGVGRSRPFLSLSFRLSPLPLDDPSGADEVKFFETSTDRFRQTFGQQSLVRTERLERPPFCVDDADTFGQRLKNFFLRQQQVCFSRAHFFQPNPIFASKARVRGRYSQNSLTILIQSLFAQWFVLEGRLEDFKIIFVIQAHLDRIIVLRICANNAPALGLSRKH